MAWVAQQSSREELGTLASSVATPAPRPRRRLNTKETGKSFLFTLIVVVVLAAFLSPLLRAVFVSLKTPEQVGQADAPQYPAVHATFVYLVEDEGERLVLRAASDPYSHLVGQIALERGEGIACIAVASVETE